MLETVRNYLATFLPQETMNVLKVQLMSHKIVNKYKHTQVKEFQYSFQDEEKGPVKLDLKEERMVKTTAQLEW